VALIVRAHIDAMSSPRPSWRPLLAGTVGLFLIILAFLAGQLRAGGDPALGRPSAATQQTQDQRQIPQQTAPPQSTAPDDGFVPGGTAPAPPLPDGSSQSSDAPSTHQS
jgi:hypothetical protein